MKKTKETSREQAMNWWNNLSPLKKTQLCDTNTGLVGSIRRWETLTGSEIEYIYHKEHSTEIDSDKLKEDLQDHLNTNYGNKSNRKQFKVFNPELHLKHLNKFDINNRINAIATGLLTIPISIDDIHTITTILQKYRE